MSRPGKTLLVGAGIPIADSTQFENGVVIADVHGGRPFHQRIPVPIAMWNPVQQDGTVPIHLFGPGTAQVAQGRIGILICYEQLLVWPVLRSAAEAPTLLIAVSNSVVICHSVVPSVQKVCSEAWARLFGYPVVIAANS